MARAAAPKRARPEKATLLAPEAGAELWLFRRRWELSQLRALW